MKDIKSMSTEELLRAIDYCLDTSTNLTSHGQADDYLVGSAKMVAIYQNELKRRELLAQKKEELH